MTKDQIERVREARNEAEKRFGCGQLVKTDWQRGYLSGLDKALQTLDQMKVSEWMPIETVYMNGKDFLGFIPARPPLRAHCIVLNYDEQGSLFTNGERNSWDVLISWNPTHWMPLPPPPKEDK